MLAMLIILDTSHFERSPLNLSAPGTGFCFASTNNQLMSVTAETFQDPIGPCGPLEQSVGGSFRHSAMAALNSAVDFGAHAVARYYRVHTVGVRPRVICARARVRVWLRDRFRVRVRWLGIVSTGYNTFLNLEKYYALYSLYRIDDITIYDLYSGV